MKIIISVVDLIFECLKLSIHDVMLFPGKNLKPVFRFSVGLTIISIICEILHLGVLQNWIANVIATCILGGIILISKGGKVNDSIRTDVPDDVYSGTVEREIEGTSTSN